MREFLKAQAHALCGHACRPLRAVGNAAMLAGLSGLRAVALQVQHCVPPTRQEVHDSAVSRNARPLARCSSPVRLQVFWPEGQHFLRPVKGRYTFANLHGLGVGNVLCAWVRPAVSAAPAGFSACCWHQPRQGGCSVSGHRAWLSASPFSCKPPEGLGKVPCCQAVGVQ